MKKVTYINKEGKEETKLCWQVCHYKHFTKLSYYIYHQGVRMGECMAVNHENVIKIEEVK